VSTYFVLVDTIVSRCFRSEKVERLDAHACLASRACPARLADRGRHVHAARRGWLQALKDDKRLIFTAAVNAQQAVDYLHGVQPAAA
jgi:antirestriction protein ArdC